MVNSPVAPEGVSADVFACQSTTGNPDMSEDKGLAYAAMIQEFICPRIYAALDLGNANNACDIKETQLNRKLISTMDITGKTINPKSTNTMSLEIYDDGSVEKKYLIK